MRLRLQPEVREEILQRLLMLMHKDIPNHRPVKKERAAAPKPKVYAVPADRLTIRPEDPPGVKKLKRIAALDSTQRENLPEGPKPRWKTNIPKIIHSFSSNRTCG